MNNIEIELNKPLPVNPSTLVDTINKDKFYEILAVACKLEIFRDLTENKTAGELAQKRLLDEQTVGYLLEVLVAGGYLLKERDSYKSSLLAETYLVKHSFLDLTHLFLQDFAPGSLALQLLRALKGTESLERGEPNWNPDRLRQIGVGSLIGSLYSTIEACDLTGAKRMLDLGGGHGFYSIAFAQKYPALEIDLFDLSQVIPLAKEFVKRFALEQRIHFWEGNFLQDQIGEGYDVVLCSNILHSDKRGIVLPKVYQSLNPGGKIIIKCRVKDSKNDFPTALAKLQWHLQGGREIYPQKTWWGFLAEQGFSQIETVDVNGIFATIIGWKNKL